MRLAGVLLLTAASACAPRAVSPAAPPAPPPLHLTPLADLVPAAGLSWIADLRPRAFFADATLIPALAEVFPEAELDAAARERGGLDLRGMDGFVAAGYDSGTLLLAHQLLEPAKLEGAFAGRVADVQGRAIDRGGDDPRGAIIRTWGARGTSHETLVVFGREAAGLALGSDTRLRAAELFAEGKLKRAQPAWRTPPLDGIAARLGDAPLRVAVPGPFTGLWSKGVGGLLAAATGAGGAVWVEGGAARVKIVLTGNWGERAEEAAQRLRSCYEALTDTGLGRLLGLPHPVAAPTVTAAPDGVALEVRLAVEPLLRGLADATTSQLRDLMQGGPTR